MTTQCTRTGFISLGQQSFQTFTVKGTVSHLMAMVATLEGKEWMCRPITTVQTSYLRNEDASFDSTVIGIRVDILNWTWPQDPKIFLCQIRTEGYLILAWIDHEIRIVASTDEIEQAKPILLPILKAQS
jgi:hypothetical protein